MPGQVLYGEGKTKREYSCVSRGTKKVIRYMVFGLYTLYIYIRSDWIGSGEVGYSQLVLCLVELDRVGSSKSHQG